jgi:DNA-binding NarL/FixJ family response regulator
MPQPIRVFHVEDYKIMRDGVSHLLGLDEEIEMVGGAKNGEEFLIALETISFSVLILDLFLDAMEDLKTMNGFQICRLMTKKHPKIAVVCHSVYDDADRVSEILKAGALGFVSKKSGYQELVLGVKSVYAGNKFICAETAARLKNLEAFLSGIDQNLKNWDETFSQREREVLDLLASGRSSRQIAESLFITERTVESHRKNMLAKAKVKNTVELISYAAALGLIRKTFPMS